MSVDRDAQMRTARAEVTGLSASRSKEAQAYPFVTISRQAGAGGHLLAQAMLDVFARDDDHELFGGWHVFDRRLCEIVAEDTQLSGYLDSLLSEHYRSRVEDFIHHLWTTTTDQDYAMQRVFHVVRTLARVGKSIILGRGSAQVTRDMPKRLSVRLVASEPVRIARLMAEQGIDELDARDQARTRDTHRARMVRHHFRVDIDDPFEYDAVWNTDLVSVEEIAAGVAGVLRRRGARS